MLYPGTAGQGKGGAPAPTGRRGGGARDRPGSPANGAVLSSGAITVNVKVTNFNVVDKQGQANVPGEGHIHYYLDVPTPTTPGQQAIPSGGVWAHVSGTSYTFENVPVGLHTFYVQLVNNDHTPLSPNVTDSIQMYVITYTGGLGGQ